MSDFVFNGGFNDLCATTRVRLARNLKGYPYRNLSDEKKNEIADKVMAAIAAAPAISSQFTRQTLRPNDPASAALVERHLISPDFARMGGPLITTADGGVSIMIGEEDHLRIQILGHGLCPRECMDAGRRLASLIEAGAPMDYSEQFGYLTACPSNLGTGLRASVMLHLPVLASNGGLNQLINRAARQGFTVRGAYGEGSQAVGGFYQLSNQVTLGLSEDAILDRLIDVATETITMEKRAREALRAANEPALADKICRAVGALQTARLMTSSEALDNLSFALMGVQLGYCTGVTGQELVAAEQASRPALLFGDANERDLARAKNLRAVAKKIVLSE